MREKKIGVFATFGGPPFNIFEKEMVFKPMADRVAMLGGHVVANIGISSASHEGGYMPLFRLASRSLLDSPLKISRWEAIMPPKTFSLSAMTWKGKDQRIRSPE